VVPLLLQRAKTSRAVTTSVDTITLQIAATKKPSFSKKLGFLSSRTLTEPDRRIAYTPTSQDVAASFSFFIGRTLTFTVAGLAAKVVS
jgi:hypothetical protein